MDFEEIDRNRRHFLGAAAVTFAAHQLYLVRPASAQSKTPSLPAVNPEAFFPGFSAESVETGGAAIRAFCERVPVDRCCCCMVILKRI
jgi:hypothetical protein